MGKGAERRKKQKEQKRIEHQLLPQVEGKKFGLVIEAWEGRIIDPIAQQDPEARRADTKTRLNTRLQNPGPGGAQKVLDTYAAPVPNGYYVIVGCGAAAIINHTTLRQSKKGKEWLGDLPVMHIGLPDPWGNYHRHGMGQPPYLLRMPGYHYPVALDAETVRSGCSSEVFAESTDNEWEELSARFQPSLTRAWVAAIQSRDQNISADLRKKLIALGIPATDLDTLLKLSFRDEDPPFRLVVVLADGKPRLVYAHKIDICTGAGSMRVEMATVPPTLLEQAKRKPWLYPDVWDATITGRLVIHGMDGLTEETPWSAGQRICVYGGGGIGLNQVERAEDVEGVCLDWLARRTLHDTFNLRRNDTVLQHPTTGRRMDPGDAENIRRALKPDGTIDFNTTVPLVPGSADWRFAQNSVLDQVTQRGTKAVTRITASATAQVFDNYAPPERVILNGQGCFPFSTAYGLAHTALVVDEFDRVILCNGQVQTSPGEAQPLTGLEFNPIIFHDRLVGAQTHHGNIRVLGAAAAMFPNMNTKDPWKAMETYRLGLPVSAVLPGFVLSGVNIAAANGWFDEKPNKNANTVSQDELLALLAGVPNADVIARAIVKLRSYPNNGFADIQKLRTALAGDPATSGLGTDCATALGKLATDYRAADDWTAGDPTSFDLD